MHTMPTWNPDLSVGNARLDEQHIRMSELAREAIDLIKLPRGAPARARLPLILEELIRVTVSHFADEEQLLEQNHYPNLAQHKAGHSQYLETLTQLAQREIEEGQDSLGMTKFLYRFWYDHMLQEDLICKDYLHD